MILVEEEKKHLSGVLRSKGIKDEKLLEAIYKVPREKFISDALRKYAYDDNALPIECHQTISQPFTVAYMTQALDVKAGHKVLEIGTGSGYQTAILSEMGAYVYTVERIKHLAITAKELLFNLGYNFQIKFGDGTMGWEEYAPYDRIIVTAGAPAVPQPLIQQLKNEGKMVIPVGSRDTQKLYEIIKMGNDAEYIVHERFKFVPLIGEEGWNT
jgi:protein-L-isoaspartate(D-aspartate) O-methyltransferase